MIKKTRGYFSIGIFNAQKECNIGTLWRSANCFNAAFIYTIGKRYVGQSSDTTKAERHIPLIHYNDFKDFLEHKPKECKIVAIELNNNSRNLINFIHPEQCIYILGSESKGIPDNILEKCDFIVEIPSTRCLNVSTTGSIVMYDRYLKHTQ